MALYSYQALAKGGKKVSGVIDAASIESVKQQLVKKGLYPTEILQAQQGTQQNFFQRFFSRPVSSKEKILLTKQLAILLESGVPLLQAFELLIDQFQGNMRTILVQIKDDLKEGISLADSLEKYPRVFETIYIQLVRAGEASGRLEIILDRLKDYLERREEISARVKGALQYPLIQLVVAALVVGVLLTFVVPQMAANFASQGQKLPGPTQLIITISDFLVAHYILLISIITVSFFTFSYWKSTKNGQRRLDEIKLKLPLIKFLTKTNAVVQFSYALGMLIEGGVNLASALDIVVQIIDNRILADALKEARENIIKEGKIAQYLEETKMFPPIALYLIRTGESSGELDKMLLTVAQTYEKEVGEIIDRLTSFIGPVMLVVMALIVGFIVIAVALPIVNQANMYG